MAAENPWYIEEFNRRVENSQTISRTASNRQHYRHLDPHDAQEIPSIHNFTWEKGKGPTFGRVFSTRALTHDRESHLRIITLPRASPQQLPDFEHLYSLFDIPNGFVSEILQSTTHSFGTRGLGNDSYTLWAQLLCVRPSRQADERPQWLNSGLVLRQEAPNDSSEGQTLLILFEPPNEIWQLINNLFHSKKWESVLKDPFILLNLVFEAWSMFVDQHAWTILDRVTTTEKDLFKQSRQSGTVRRDKLAIDYTNVHLLAKDAIHLVEGVDAALRSLNCILDAHDDVRGSNMSKDSDEIWKSTSEALKHRIEILQSTRLRLASVDQRLKNIINLAFNLSTSYDSKVMLGDSYAMRTLSFLALVFLPISTISTIFGSEFFGTDDVPLPNGSTKATLKVSSQFWILWALSIPATLLILLGWLLWLRRSQRRYGTPGKKSAHKGNDSV